MKVQNIKSKSVAVVLSLLMMATPPISFGAQAIPAPHLSPNLIPEDVGSVEESFAGQSGKTIIYIQDSHDSLEAQLNIAAMIDHLVENQNVRTVLEEGYEGVVPTDKYFNIIEDRSMRKNVSDLLLDELQIGGAEYAHINRTREFKLIGADSLELHAKNIKWYQEMAKHQRQVEQDISEMATHLKNLINTRFSKTAKERIKQKEKLANHEIGLLEHLSSGHDVLVKETSREHVRKLYPTICIIIAASQEGEEEQLKGLKAHRLFEELKEFETEVMEHLLETEGNKEIYRHYQAVELLRKLNRLEVSSEEFYQTKGLLEEIDTLSMADFLSKETGRTVVLSKGWQENIKNAILFYETANARDQKVAESLREFEKVKGESTAVLVFGGFHKERIRNILRKNDHSYHIVTPRITEISEKHRLTYRRLMSGKASVEELLSQLAQFSRLKPIFVALENMEYQAAARALQMILRVRRENPTGGFNHVLRTLSQKQNVPVLAEATVRSEVRKSIIADDGDKVSISIASRVFKYAEIIATNLLVLISSTFTTPAVLTATAATGALCLTGCHIVINDGITLSADGRHGLSLITILDQQVIRIHDFESHSVEAIHLPGNVSMSPELRVTDLEFINNQEFRVIFQSGRENHYNIYGHEIALHVITPSVDRTPADITPIPLGDYLYTVSSGSAEDVNDGLLNHNQPLNRNAGSIAHLVLSESSENYSSLGYEVREGTMDLLGLLNGESWMFGLATTSGEIQPEVSQLVLEISDGETKKSIDLNGRVTGEELIYEVTQEDLARVFTKQGVNLNEVKTFEVVLWREAGSQIEGEIREALRFNIIPDRAISSPDGVIAVTRTTQSIVMTHTRTGRVSSTPLWKFPANTTLETINITNDGIYYMDDRAENLRLGFVNYGTGYTYIVNLSEIISEDEIANISFPNQGVSTAEVTLKNGESFSFNLDSGVVITDAIESPDGTHLVRTIPGIIINRVQIYDLNTGERVTVVVPAQGIPQENRGIQHVEFINETDFSVVLIGGAEYRFNIYGHRVALLEIEPSNLTAADITDMPFDDVLWTVTSDRTTHVNTERYDNEHFSIESRNGGSIASFEFEDGHGDYSLLGYAVRENPLDLLALLDGESFVFGVHTTRGTIREDVTQMVLKINGGSHEESIDLSGRRVGEELIYEVTPEQLEHVFTKQGVDLHSVRNIFITLWQEAGTTFEGQVEERVRFNIIPDSPLYSPDGENQVIRTPDTLVINHLLGRTTTYVDLWRMAEGITYKDLHVTNNAVYYIDNRSDVAAIGWIRTGQPVHSRYREPQLVRLPGNIVPASAQAITFPYPGQAIARVVDVEGQEHLISLETQSFIEFSPNGQYLVSHENRLHSFGWSDLIVRNQQGVEIGRVTANDPSSRSLYAFQPTNEGVYYVVKRDSTGPYQFFFASYNQLDQPVETGISASVELNSNIAYGFTFDTPGSPIVTITSNENDPLLVNLETGSFLEETPDAEHYVSVEGGYIVVFNSLGIEMGRVQVSAQQASLVNYHVLSNGVYYVISQRGNTSSRFVAFDHLEESISVELPEGIQPQNPSAITFPFPGEPIYDVLSNNRRTYRIFEETGAVAERSMSGEYLVAYDEESGSLVLQNARGVELMSYQVSAQQVSLVDYQLTDNALYINLSQRGNAIFEVVYFNELDEIYTVELPMGVSPRSPEAIYYPFPGKPIADIESHDRNTYRIDLETLEILRVTDSEGNIRSEIRNLFTERLNPTRREFLNTIKNFALAATACAAGCDVGIPPIEGVIVLNNTYSIQLDRAGETIQRPGSNVQNITLINDQFDTRTPIAVTDHPANFGISPEERYVLHTFYVPNGAQTPFVSSQIDGPLLSGLKIYDIFTQETRTYELINPLTGQFDGEIVGYEFISNSRVSLEVIRDNGQRELVLVDLEKVETIIQPSDILPENMNSLPTYTVLLPDGKEAVLPQIAPIEPLGSAVDLNVTERGARALYFTGVQAFSGITFTYDLFGTNAVEIVNLEDRESIQLGILGSPEEVLVEIAAVNAAGATVKDVVRLTGILPTTEQVYEIPLSSFEQIEDFIEVRSISVIVTGPSQQGVLEVNIDPLRDTIQEQIVQNDERRSELRKPLEIKATDLITSQAERGTLVVAAGELATLTDAQEEELHKVLSLWKRAKLIVFGAIESNNEKLSKRIERLTQYSGVVYEETFENVLEKYSKSDTLVEVSRDGREYQINAALIRNLKHVKLKEEVGNILFALILSINHGQLPETVEEGIYVRDAQSVYAQAIQAILSQRVVAYSA